MHLVLRSKPPTKEVFKEIRNWSALDAGAFRGDIKSRFDFNYIDTYQVDCLTGIYQTSLMDALDKFAPITLNKCHNRNPKPWVNDSLRGEIQKRRRLEREWRKSPGRANFDRFSKQCTNVKDIEQGCMKAYYRDKISSKDPKIISTAYKKMFLGNSDQNSYPRSFTDHVLANKFNHFFQEKVQTIIKVLAPLKTNTSSNVLYTEPNHCYFSKFQLKDKIYIEKISYMEIVKAVC